MSRFESFGRRFYPSGEDAVFEAERAPERNYEMLMIKNPGHERLTSKLRVAHNEKI